MKQWGLFRWILFAVLSAAMLSQTAQDTVHLQCSSVPSAPCPPGDNGVLLVSDVNALPFPPNSGTVVPVGNVAPAYHEAVAFRADRAPAIQTSLTWTNGADTATLAYHEMVEVPLQVWVICGHHKARQPDCSAYDATVTFVKGFIAKANDVLARERVGIKLVPAAAGDAWITNEIENPTLAAFREFTDDQCANLDLVLSAPGSGLKNPKALNMYLTETVRNEPGYGVTCSIQTPQFTVTGETASWRTMLHEFGHTLSLAHVQRDQSWKYSRPENYMYAYSSVRQYFSEGQVFLAQFSSESIIHKPLGLGSGSRDCDDPSKPPCPPVDTWIWPDE